jgi:hypothetical protein
MTIRKTLRWVFLLWACLGGAASAQTLFSSDFSGREGQRPLDYVFDTEDEAFWAVRGGWLDTGNGQDIITPEGYSFAAVKTPGADKWSDYELSCRFQMVQANGQVILAGRWIDRRNHYEAAVEVYGGRRFFKLVKKAGGRSQDLKSEAINLADLGVSTIENGSPASALNLSLSFVGSQITASLGGRIQLVANDYDILTGSVAVGELYTRALFRDIVVRPSGKAGAALGAGAPSAPGGRVYTVQLNEFDNVVDARNLSAQLRLQGYAPYVEQAGAMFRVSIGRFAGTQEAYKMLAQLVSEQFVFAKVVETRTPYEASPPPAGPAPLSRPSADALAGVPEEARSGVDWTSLTPSQQRRIADAIRNEEALRSRTQSVAEIMDLKKKIDSLTEKEATILNILQQSDTKEKKRVIDVNRLVTKIDGAIDGQDYKAATTFVDQLAKIDPANPVVIMKRTKIKHLKGGTWEGYEQYKENLHKEIVRLQSEAAGKEASNNLEDAKSAWMTVMAKAPLNAELVARARKEIERLNGQIAEQKAKEEASQERKANLKIVAGVGGLAAALVVAVVFLYLLVRRRHAQVLLQMQEQAIAPLQDLREKTRALASGRGAGARGLAFGAAAGQGLLDQTESPDAEFVIPDTEPRAGNEPAAGADDLSPAIDLDTPAQGAPKPQVKTQEVKVEKRPAPKPAPGGPVGDEDFTMDFGEEEELKKDKRVSTLPRSPSSGDTAEGQSEEVVFAFDDFQPAPASPAERTEAPVTAAEIATGASVGTQDDLVFSFDDTGPGSPSAPAAPAPVAAAPARPQPRPAQDSTFESVSLDDLDLSAPPPAQQTSPVAASTGGSGSSVDTMSPLTDDLDLNLDLRIEMPADREQTATTPAGSSGAGGATTGGGVEMPDLLEEETSPTPLAASAPAPSPAPAAGGVLLQQIFDAATAGSMPQTWSGDATDYATLAVVQDPDGGGCCLQFKKTRGEGPTSFTCRFPDVSGRVGVEFDIRCDEKNKHLLGFYIEKDGDFRRSVHTVVQCIDADRPAYLRIFTKPTPYTLSSWRHIKYIIDLPNGLVDGYVDNRLVAEGVRMGTKTDSLNTFSIRDNTESTGVLFLNNLVIYKAPEGA